MFFLYVWVFNMFGFLSYFNFNRAFCFYSCEAHPKAEISIIQKESLFLSLNFTSHNKVYRLFCFQTCIIDYFLWILMNITKIKKHCKLLINCFPLQTNLHLAGMGESFSVFFFFRGFFRLRLLVRCPLSTICSMRYSQWYLWYFKPHLLKMNSVDLWWKEQ